MVSVTQEAELNRLENQVDNGGGGAWEYLCLLQKLNLRRSHKVVKHGLPILNNDPTNRSALTAQEWTLYEQVALAAMDCQRLDVAKIIHKRRVAIAKAQGNISSAIESLNKYLDIFMADHDAWRELAEIYISLQMYKQAAFCYEEVILGQPTVALYHLAYADVLYTLGGLENLQTAKKYYASTIDLSGGKNTRALFGICLCVSAISQLSKGRNKEDKESSKLHSLAATALEKEYKQRAPEKLISVVTCAVRSLKVYQVTSGSHFHGRNKGVNLIDDVLNYYSISILVGNG